MKIIVSMNDPDCLEDAVHDAVCREMKATLDALEPDEQEDVIRPRKEKVRGKMMRWFKYGEYLRVEVDTEAGTCTVLDA